MLKIDNEKFNEMIKKAIDLKNKPLFYVINDYRFYTNEYEIIYDDNYIFVRNYYYFEWCKFNINEIKVFSFAYE